MTDTELQAEVERLTDRLAKAEAALKLHWTWGQFQYAVEHEATAALAAYDTAPRN